MTLLNDILKSDKDHRFDEAKAPFLISLPSVTIIYLLYIIGITVFAFKFLFGAYAEYIEYLISLGLVIQRMIPTSNLILNSLNTVQFKNISLIKIYDYYKLMQTEATVDENINIISRNIYEKKSSFTKENNNYLISIRPMNYRYNNSDRYYIKMN